MPTRSLYRHQMGSDIQRDGMVLELVEGATGDVVGEVFYGDRSGQLSISLDRPNLPLEAVEELIAAARDRLPPSDLVSRSLRASPRPDGAGPMEATRRLAHEPLGDRPAGDANGNTFRLYTDLAWLWPMWGDAADEYAHYCRHVTGLIERHARRPAGTLLDIGCGGGKNVFNLKERFSVTGLDLSPTMLAQASTLNPECTFVQGDMRTFRLGRTFDAVLMDDAISYMACLADFEAALRTASTHLNPGGVLIATPDVNTETFRQNRTVVTPGRRTDARAGLDVVFVENAYDPDPADERYEMTILYLIRDQGRLRIETDHWTMGLFPLDTWRRVLREGGFEVHEGTYGAGEDQYTVFACVKGD